MAFLKKNRPNSGNNPFSGGRTDERVVAITAVFHCLTSALCSLSVYMRITIMYSVIIFIYTFILYKQTAKMFTDKLCFQPIFSNRRANNASNTFICVTELCFSRFLEKTTKYSEKWASYKLFILKIAAFFLTQEGPARNARTGGRTTC